jgi:hypothetical protein
MGQPHTGQEIKGDLSSQKMEASQRANAQQENHQLNSSNQQPISTTTQTTESNDVPTTTQNLYEKEGGWNISQSHTGQGIKGSFSPQKNDTAISTTSNRDELLPSTNTQITESNNVPTSSKNLYEIEGGWNIGQPHTGQEIEGDLASQKLEDEIATTPNLDEPLSSLNTQTIESDNVPTTPKKLYESDGGWNTNQSQNGQRVEGDFSPRKNEAIDDDLQICLKQLRQVKTADDYWEVYERSSQLVEEAWKLLHSPEQLRIQQICEEGIDPLSRWLEGDRVWLWHPFAEKKWGLATVKQVVRGACGFIYALRDDGFGLHLGREKLHLIAPINIESS